MAFTPYSTPIQFEYKPLGLEAFAKPLAQMQGQYDLAGSQLAASTYGINALSPDKETRDRIEKELTAKKDEIAAGLLKSKNYRQATRQLMDLNKLYQSHPEIKALESEYAQTAQWIKEGDEAAAKGTINKPLWEQRKANALAQYGTEGGLSYDPFTKSYKSVDRRTLGQDREKELQELAMKIGAAKEEELIDIATSHGMDPSTFQWVTSDGTIHRKTKEDIQAAIIANLADQPRFRDWLSEVGSIQADTQQYQNPAEFNDWATKQYTSEIQYYDEYLKTLEPGTPKHSAILNKRNSLAEDLQSGNIDPNTAKSMYTNNYTQDYINQVAKDVSGIYAYDRRDVDKSWSNINELQAGAFGLGPKVPVTPPAGFAKSGQSPEIKGFDIHESINKNRQNIDSQFQELRGIGKISGTNKSYFDILIDTKDRIKAAGVISIIDKANNKAKSADQFVKLLNDSGVNTKGKEQYYKGWYKQLSTQSGKINFHEAAVAINNEAGHLQTNKQQYKNLKEGVDNSKEMNEFFNDQKNSIVYSLEQPVTDQYGVEQPSLGDVLGISNSKELDNYIAKNSKYKTLGQALKAGADLSKIGKLGQIPSIRSIKTNYDNKVFELVQDESYTTNESKYYVVGDDAKAKALRNNMQGILQQSIQNGNLESMVPVYGGGWANQPGFDEKGNFIGEVNNKTFAMVKTEDGRLYASVEVKVDPKKYPDAKGGTVRFYVKDKVLERKFLDVAISTQENQQDELAQRNTQMFQVARFDSNHPFSPGIEESSKRLIPKAGEYIPIDAPFNTTIQNTGVIMRIAKTGLSGGSQAGKPNFRYVAQYQDDQGKWVSIDSSKSESIDKVKIWIDEQEN